MLAHHMFLLGGSSLSCLLFALLLLVPVALGVELARRAFSTRSRVTRRVAVTSFVLFLLAMVAPILSLTMLTMGTLGIDIQHR
jgi:hypothetical protein